MALLGIIVWAIWRHPGFLFIAAGIFSHQLADAMWAAPRSWYWPFLGSFPPKYVPFYFKDMFSLEISSPSELLVVVLAIILCICLVQSWRTKNTLLFRRAAGLVGLLLIVAGAIVISGSAADLLPGFLVYARWSDILICALSLLLGGTAFLLVSFFPPVGCAAKDFL